MNLIRKISVSLMSLACAFSVFAQTLELSPIYTDGIVLQRYQPIKIMGNAAPGRTVQASFGANSALTSADQDGRWSVCLPPMQEASGLTLTVTDGESAITLSDVAVGEVWIASGQSNMRFTMAEDAESTMSIQLANDSLLRFFNMQPCAQTYAGRMSDAALDSIDRYQYFRPTAWQHSSPESLPPMSAVAYYFARVLRDSLDVPVGIINNSIGGSTTESWIDETTLNAELPDMLQDWTSNRYSMPWAQKRALDNMGGDRSHHHPYEPGYLYHTGMKPIEDYPVAGVIWYQGESNAHDVAMHSRLFPMLVESWRRNWHQPEMPFYYVQLSSIGRPTWPEFRNSQREMMSQLRNVGMAVSHDYGDSIDVHPRVKRPVGERLARWALNRTYGFSSVTPSGPLPLKADVCDGALLVSMAYGDSMRSSDGKPLRCFEAAGADHVFYPAVAEVVADGLLRISSSDVPDPQYARYAWQPFTRANLTNGEGLPASTFEIEAQDAYGVEEGYDRGVSAMFAGTIGHTPIIAGGCNFPANPLAPDSKRKTYRGIYAICDGQLQRIGTMPKALAYGASAVLPDGIAMIGGSGPEGSSTDAWLVRLEGGIAKATPLPQLPCTIDNAAAASIGNKIYVAGGNVDGVPSNAAFMLDIDNLEQGWTRLKDFPGTPRVQPAIAIGKDKKAHDRLCVFGGYAPATPSNSPSLSSDGYAYDARSNKWERLSGPTDDDGISIALAGATTVSLPDGRIAFAGGVNKDIFQNALASTPPDYLSHKAAWYKFNDALLIYDLSSKQWSTIARDSDYARAGAMLTTDGDDCLLLIGGEIKPRVRTPKITAIDFLK